VNAQTRLRVQEAAHALGYRPDAGARRLVRGSTDAIGIVYSAAVENLGNPQFLDMAGGLAERLEQQQFDLLLAVASNDQELRIYDRLFRGGRVDAVVIPNTHLQDSRIDYLLEKKYPFLGYGRTENCSDYSWFDFDNERGSVLAVEHLLRLGHTAIAYVHSSLALNFSYQRRQGFIAALNAAGLTCPPSYQVGPAADRRSGLEAVMKLLAQENPPTAIVVDNNLGGVGVLRGLLAAGIQVGKDISVVVQGEIPVDTLLDCADVTTVTQPTAYETGVKMADMVLRLLQAPNEGPYQMLKQPELVPGMTTGPAP